jgi:hypothetical protein
MTDRYHTTPDGNIPFTEDEEAARDAEEAAWEADAIPRAAMVEIARLETIPRRIRENLISLGTEDQVVIDEDAAIAVEREKL